MSIPESPEKLRYDIELLLKNLEELERKEAQLLEGSDFSVTRILENASTTLSHIRAQRKIERKKERAESLKKKCSGVEVENLELCEDIVEEIDTEVDRLAKIIQKARSLKEELSREELSEKLIEEYQRDYKFTEHLKQRLEQEWKTEDSSEGDGSEKRSTFQKIKDRFT